MQYYFMKPLSLLFVNGPPTEKPRESMSDVRTIEGPLLDGIQLLERAARRNDTDALYLLAHMNFFGNFTHPRNYSEAFNRFHELATLNGNSSAQHMVGLMHATGIGNAAERDEAKAMLYHTFAALGGDTKSEMTLAYRYYTGIGTARSCDQATAFYKKVADKAIQYVRSGPPGGRALLPDLYRLADEEGGVYGEGASVTSSGNHAHKGGPNSDAHAALDDVLEYLDLMSRKGDFKATFSLGRLHYDGQKGLRKNMRKAKAYFLIVAKLYWTRDGRRTETDKPGVEKYAAKAAGYLGLIFLRGESVEQNFENARVWFERGIPSGDPGAQNGLGIMYLHGLGVPKNPTKAADYFKAAAIQDFALAQVNLGALYLDQGETETATRYFEAAARYKHVEALYYLAELANQAVGKPRNCEVAAKYYKSVAERAEVIHSSFIEANQAYEAGDLESALVNNLMAAEQGYENAQINVAYLLDQQRSKLVLPQSMLFSKPKPTILQNAALALVYWTRSSKQGYVDSWVKMGDYYLNGVGTEVSIERAATCYTAAADYQQSAQALYNLGWMHENGVGQNQDFHLAKRFYDQALETNVEAYLPVTLSLLRLRLRSAWNTITHGDINSIHDEPGMQMLTV